jgi:hypothetical protein
MTTNFIKLAKAALLILFVSKISFGVSNNSLASLLNLLKKYEVTQSKHHEGNLYEHSVWTYKTVNKWWDEQSPWVKGIDEKKYKKLSIIAALLHDIGKAGDLFYFYKEKKTHPKTGFDMILQKRPFWYVDDNNKYGSFDLDDMFKTELGLNDQDIKILAIIVGMHWEFGNLMMETAKSEQDEKGNLDLTKLPEEVLFNNYLTSVADFAAKANLDVNLIDEELLRLIILVSAADVKGASWVSYDKDVLGLPDTDRARNVDDQVFQKYKFDTLGHEIKEGLLKYFEQNKAKYLAREKNRVVLDAFDNIKISSSNPSQTQALLSLNFVKESVIATFGEKAIAQYSNLINKMITNERKYSSTHLVFYHAAPKQVEILSDFLTDIYAREIAPATIDRNNFRLLRYSNYSLYDKFKNKNQFLDYEVKNFNVVHDTPTAHDKPDWDIQSLILSVNPFIFGNATVNTRSECSFDYFISNKERANANLQGIFTKVLSEQVGINSANLHHAIDLNYFANKFTELSKMLTNDEGVIFQIFVPYDKVDQISYFARNYGHPFGNAVVLNYLFNREIPKDERLSSYWNLLKRDPSMALKVDPVYSSVNNVLQKFKEDPKLFPNVLRWQIRLLFTKDILLSKDSGVIIKTYSTDNEVAQKKYEAARAQVMDELVAAIKGQPMPKVIEITSLNEITSLINKKEIEINSKTLFISELEDVLVHYRSNIENEIKNMKNSVLNFYLLGNSKDLALIKYNERLTDKYKKAYPKDFEKNNKVIKSTKENDFPTIIKDVDKKGATTLALSFNDQIFENWGVDYAHHDFAFNFQKKVIDKIFPEAAPDAPIIFPLDNMSENNKVAETQYKLTSFGYDNNVLYTGLRPYADEVILSFFHALGYLKLQDGEYVPTPKFTFDNLIFVGKNADLANVFAKFGKYFKKVSLIKRK